MSIPITQNFDVQGPIPIESRVVQNTIEDRDLIPSASRYDGLVVYVKAAQQSYQLIGGITNAHWQYFPNTENIDTITHTNRADLDAVSGVNTGDDSINTRYKDLETNATHTGDATGSAELTVVGLQGKAIPLPSSEDNMKVLVYNHGTEEFEFTASIIAQLTGTVSGYVVAEGSSDTSKFLNGAGEWSTPTVPEMTSTKGGIVPTPPNDTSKFLRGDGVFATPAVGNMILGDKQSVTGEKVFIHGKFSLRNVANTYSAQFINTVSTNRLYTLQDANGVLAFLSDILVERLEDISSVGDGYALIIKANYDIKSIRIVAETTTPGDISIGSSIGVPTPDIVSATAIPTIIGNGLRLTYIVNNNYPTEAARTVHVKITSAATVTLQIILEKIF